ncbi:toxin glutamine deamidase domain-containing protein [Hamadaea tsunoensis]|uniref:toxin glutamine deamidase domain-containing protein n=1 Tax=Hamadaea tsunoensis TaxID=53368 RepID=UPI0004164453|nr:toxin glutamine deamidase domain-containing protein [Hamadaea tsunoensis]
MTSPPDTASSRTSNALECALAFLSTYSGAPRAASSLNYDPADPLSPLLGEQSGRERAEAYLGRPFEYVGPDSTAFALIARRLSDGGHGTAALIVNGWPPHLGTGTHAWNGYNHDGRIGWVDANTGARGDQPLYPEAYGVWAIIVDNTWRAPQ